MTLRAAATGDAAAVAEIYGAAVTDGAASFELTAPSPEEMARRIRETGSTYPWLVAERGGQLYGYAYATRHRDRAAYRWSADVTVYVRREAHGRGVGRRLYGALLPILRLHGYVTACAGIALPNPASVALHEAFGFTPVGVYRSVGYKHGSWRDVGWWQLTLREPPATPDPPVSFAAIASDTAVTRLLSHEAP